MNLRRYLISVRHGLISVTPPYDLKGLGPAIDGPESTSQTPQDTNIVDGGDMDADRPGDLCLNRIGQRRAGAAALGMRENEWMFTWPLLAV